MKKAAWKRRIRQACEEAGVYKPAFDYTIDGLAGIMELKDAALKEFKDSGSEIIVEYTNKNGSTNTVKNPALVVIMDCNTQALAYWKELGLTPAGLKRITSEGMAQKPKKAQTTTLDAIRAKHAK